MFECQYICHIPRSYWSSWQSLFIIIFLQETITVQEESSPGDSKEVLEIDWGNLGGVEEEGGGEGASGDIDFGDGDIDYDVLVDIDIDLAGITVEDGGDSCKFLLTFV